MLLEINNFLQIIIILIGTFMVERYVLLEPALEDKKQKIFYLVSFCVVLITYFIFKNDIPQYVALFFGALNILLARKKQRVLGAIMVLPLIGIINGLASPIFIIQFLELTFLNLNEKDILVQLPILFVYIIFGVLLVLFYFKGKNWRNWFKENMKDRSPSISERILIFITGIVITVFSISIEYLTYGINMTPEVKMCITYISIFFESIALLTTIIIIVLVMQGNKQKFYHDRVSNMQFSVIATMADIVEDRDSNTGGHIKRTAKYVEIIGNYLLKRNEYKDVLTKQYLEDMVVAAPLHDIGKISVPDAILNKPGRLTPEEFDIMKKHASAGREVLAKAEKQMGKFDYLEIAMDMAEFHHEWFNGNGYPTGLKGEEIPLCARIMAVADVFDALTSKRCYKDSMPLEKAYSIIKEESGTHFDPKIAEAFLNSKKEIEETINKFVEN